MTTPESMILSGALATALGLVLATVASFFPGDLFRVFAAFTLAGLTWTMAGIIWDYASGGWQ
jgi:hypothetical protein